jgi:hypothetical protein
LPATGGETAQQRRPAPKGGDKCLGLALGFGEPDPGRCALQQSSRQFVLQREKAKPLALVAGRQLQAGGHETFEGLDVARCKNFVHARGNRRNRFRRPLGEMIHGVPPSGESRTGAEVLARRGGRDDGGGGCLSAGVAANIRSRVRGRDQRGDAVFGRVISAAFPKRDQTGGAGIDVGQRQHASRPAFEVVGFEAASEIVQGCAKHRPQCIALLHQEMKAANRSFGWRRDHA